MRPVRDEGEDYDLATGAHTWPENDDMGRRAQRPLPAIDQLCSCDRMKQLHHYTRCGRLPTAIVRGGRVMTMKDWDVDWTIVIVVALVMGGICLCVLGGIYLGKG